MAGKPVSGYIDEITAKRLSAIAVAEDRTPASLVGHATSFYVGLPEVARSALRRIEKTATAEERRWFEDEFVRLMLKTGFALTQREMTAQIRSPLPQGASDAEIDAAAEEWLAPAGP